MRVPFSWIKEYVAWQGTVGVEPLLPATIPLLEWLDEVRRESLATA